MLVYQHGIHATGIDAIVSASGVSRKTMYAHFGSKDVLVLAALRARHIRWMHWFRTQTHLSGAQPAERLLGMFSALESWFSAPGYHGCAFLNAAGEVADAASAIRMLSKEHKADLLAFIHDTTAQLPIPCDAQAALARQWLILVDGAIAVALVSGDTSAARDARAAGACLLAGVGVIPAPNTNALFPPPPPPPPT